MLEIGRGNVDLSRAGTAAKARGQYGAKEDGRKGPRGASRATIGLGCGIRVVGSHARVGLLAPFP